MDRSQAVQTASSDDCKQCAQPLPPRPSAKDHRFCSPRCRAAWHREAKQRSLNTALHLVVQLTARVTPGRGIALPVLGEVQLALAAVARELVAAGGEPPA